ncbi:MAG: hypothetical protein GY820_39895 [Gammaproteobacteria bacterium]|nr:hypothetical protein [Gammaproteobacteria bacterium]
MKVKAISIYNPHACMMRAGPKLNETRTWAPKYRGPLLICAAKKWSKAQQDALVVFRRYSFTDPGDGSWHFRGLSEMLERDEGSVYPDPIEAKHLYPGKAVALVNLVEVVRAEDASACRVERACGDYTPGRFVWRTTPMNTIFKPFPVKGQQGLFNVELPEGIMP